MATPAPPADPGPPPPRAAAPAAGEVRGLRFLDVAVVGSLVLLGIGVGTDSDGPGADRRLRMAVVILAGSCAALWLLVQSQRRALREIQDLVIDVRFGRGTRRDREAVDILLRAAAGPDLAVRATALRQLRRITGEDLGEDPAAWRTWWAGARASFSRGPADDPAARERPPRPGRET